MKTFILSIVLFFSSLLSANDFSGIICRDDQRLSGGSLLEVILSPTENGHWLQYQYVPSLQSPDITFENLATELSCKIHSQYAIAFCENNESKTITHFTQRKESFYDSIHEDAERESDKFIDISIMVSGNETKAFSFNYDDCSNLGA